MPVGNTLGHGLIAQVRFGDESATTGRPLSQSVPVSYTITASQHGVGVALTYTVQRANVAPLLVYYLITPPSAFAINGDSSIISPDKLVYNPRAVSGRTLSAAPVLQGFTSMIWNYSRLLPHEYAYLVSFYNPQNPVVQLTYPDELGIWQQRQAVMRPPTYGTASTVVYEGISLTFTRLQQN